MYHDLRGSVMKQERKTNEGIVFGCRWSLDSMEII